MICSISKNDHLQKLVLDLDGNNLTDASISTFETLSTLRKKITYLHLSIRDNKFSKKVEPIFAKKKQMDILLLINKAYFL